MEELTYSSVESCSKHEDFSHSKSIQIFYLNIRSIRVNDKFSELKLKLDLLNYPDVIVLTESWLGEGEEVYFQLSGYEGISFVRGQKRGGGISIYVKKDCDYSVISNFICDTNNHQIVTLSIVLSKLNEPLYLTAAYNPSALNAQNFINEFLSHASQIPEYFIRKTVILGDFNIDILNCDSELVIAYLSWYTSNNFVLATQKYPTRI